MLSVNPDAHAHGAYRDDPCANTHRGTRYRGDGPCTGGKAASRHSSADSYGHPHINSDTDHNPHADAIADSNPDAAPDPHSDADCNAHPHSDPYPDPNANADKP